MFPPPMTVGHPLQSIPLTSTGAHERQRIVQHYYPFGDPQEMQWQMAVAQKYGLAVPDNLAKAGRVYRLWNALPGYPFYNAESQGEPPAVSMPVFNAKNALFLVGGAVIVGALAFYLVSQLKKIRSGRLYEAPSIPESNFRDLVLSLNDMKRLVKHIRLAGTPKEKQRLQLLLDFNMRDMPGCSCHFSAGGMCKLCDAETGVDAESGLCRICTEMVSYFNTDKTPTDEEFIRFMKEKGIDADDLGDRLVRMGELLADADDDDEPNLKYGAGSERADEVKQLVSSLDTMFALDSDDGHVLTFIACDNTRNDLMDAVMVKDAVEDKFTDVICHVRGVPEDDTTGCVYVWVHTPPSAVNFSALDKSDYPGLFQDSDKDDIPDLDDPRPLIPGDTESVEEVRLTDELSKLIDVHNDLNVVEDRFVDKVKGLKRGKVLSRSKKPYSMVNKLIRKRLKGKKGLTDLIGGMIVVDDRSEVDDVRRKILDGELGEVIEEEDFYTNPLNGYMAYHYILDFDGNNVELQLKTNRMKELSKLSHKPYKTGRLNGDEFLKLTTLAKKADSGDKKLAKKIDALLAEPGKISKLITK